MVKDDMKSILQDVDAVAETEELKEVVVDVQKVRNQMVQLKTELKLAT